MGLAASDQLPRGLFQGFPAELLAEFRRHPLDGAEVRRLIEVARVDHLLHMEFRKLPQKLTYPLLTCLTLGIHAFAPWDMFSPLIQSCCPTLPQNLTNLLLTFQQNSQPTQKLNWSRAATA